MSASEFKKRLSCIVLIDDDDINNYINQLTLQSFNISDHIVLLKNGREGLQFIQAYFEKNLVFPELIFVDINMPVLNGFEFLEAFDKINPSHFKPTFAVLTTSTDPRDIRRLKDLGIKYFFNKPLNKEKLTGLLKDELFEASVKRSISPPKEGI
jgi:CheY-like chemotaxis protein